MSSLIQPVGIEQHLQPGVSVWTFQDQQPELRCHMETAAAPHCVVFASGAIAAAGQHSLQLCKMVDVPCCIQVCCVLHLKQLLVLIRALFCAAHGRGAFLRSSLLILVSAERLHMQLQRRVTVMLAPQLGTATHSLTTSLCLGTSLSIDGMTLHTQRAALNCLMFHQVPLPSKGLGNILSMSALNALQSVLVAE